MPSGINTRSRDIVFKQYRGIRSTRQLYPTPGPASSSEFLVDLKGRQVTVSEGHPFPSKGNRVLDLGGDFLTTRNRFGAKDVDSIIPLVSVKGESSNHVLAYTYTGPWFACDPQLDYKTAFPKADPSSDAVLKALGTTAISRCKPTNSIASLSVALAEVKREGLPHLLGSQSWKARAKSAREKTRAAGGDYLNFQFGWMPLISDIKNAAKAYQNADRIWNQYQRDAGRLVRRRYEFPLIDERTTKKFTQGVMPVGPGFTVSNFTADRPSKPGTLTLDTRVQRRRYFSGAFTYTIPTGNSLQDRILRDAARARKLYGLTIDPDVIWNLVPWSWAIDWFVNIGDMISTATDALTDGLVMPYGYMMEHTIITHTYCLSDYLIDGRSTPIYTSYVTETKKRVRASPYGFGLTWDGFSPYQLSILAALGISRGRN